MKLKKKQKKKVAMLMLGGVLLVVLGLIWRFDMFAMVKYPDGCLYYDKALEAAIEHESTTDDLCLIFDVAVAQGGCHSCSDPNIQGFDADRTYNVICSKHWETNGWIMTGTLDNDCLLDEECAKFQGFGATDDACGDEGIFASDHQFKCVDGFCKAYYMPDSDTISDDGDDTSDTDTTPGEPPAVDDGTDYVPPPDVTEPPLEQRFWQKYQTQLIVLALIAGVAVFILFGSK